MAPLDSLRAALADRYRLDRELGQGGMATVYLAHDLKLDRNVALKVLRPELAAVLGRDRFLGEIRLTAKLDHPHILTLIASGEDEGFLWYVLPYVRGESLRDRLTRDKQLGVEEAVAIAKQIAGALEYAHQHGVIHRDIKPENILLHEGEAMLADFGIALAVKEAAGNRLTETGLSLGTPQYMSPEQATGERQLDARSDVYSLAAVLYEMLAGEPPLSGTTAQAIIAKLMTERPTRLRVIRDTVPEGIDAAVAKALAKVPADRFGSARELVEALTVSGKVADNSSQKWKRPLAVVGGAAFLAVAALVVGRVGRGHTSGRLVVQDRTQLTFTGDVTNPAISADGKQVAYVTKRCRVDVCTSGIEILDLGTGTRRRIVNDVAIPTNIQWSRDRRLLLFSGSIGGQQGTYLVSTLGDIPHPISNRYLNTSPTLVPGQDSLLLSLNRTRDSVAWVAVAALGGEYGDSVPIHLGNLGALGQAFVWPGGQWMIVETVDELRGGALRHEYWAVDRLGRQRDSLRVPGDLGTWTDVRSDAFWLQLWTRGYPILRIPFDAGEGRFSATWDTVLQTSHDGFDVTEDGQSVVYLDGALEYGLWALDLSDALKGNFSQERRLRAGTSPEQVWLSPDGTQMLVLQRVATGRGEGSEIVLLPFGGGAETMHWPVDSLLDVRWMPNGQTFSYAEQLTGHVRLITVDARTGTRQNPVDIPDQGYWLWHFTSLSDGEWAWASGRVHLWRSGEREPRVLPLLKDEIVVGGLSAAPDQLRLAALALSGIDSIFLDVMAPPDGQPTRWASFSTGQRVGAYWIADSSLVIWLQESEDRAALYLVRGPGRVERLGTIPRALEDVSLSRDGRRVVLVTRDFRGDVWLTHLKRTGGN